jgi:hypothetical protein
MFIGTTIADRGVATSFYVPMIAAAAGLLGGFSMPMAHASAKFILFMIIATSLGDQGTHPVAMMLLFCLGAVWSAGLSWVLRPLFHALPPDATPINYQRPKRFRAMLKRWWKSFAGLPSWQYMIRITSCLAVAEAIMLIWPWHHVYWIAMTVAIVLSRRYPAPPMKTQQRAVGTIFGIIFASLLLIWTSPIWAKIAIVAVLGAARPILRAGNYTA